MSAKCNHRTTLVFGCDGCIARVKEDQRLAAEAEWPERTLTIEWTATWSRRGTASVTVNAPAEWSDADAANHHVELIDEKVDQAAADRVGEVPDDFDWNVER